MSVVLLAAYTLAVSVIYAAVYLVSPETADASLVFFVALLLVPACVADIKRARRRQREQ